MKNTDGTSLAEAGSWEDMKNKLKAKFSWLTDADLQYTEGKKEEMMNRLQIKIGKTKDELNKIFAGL
ncbi:MAG TPA: general stress protein CsbD [Chitinophagaceae bacterium]|nr:general stress protein CsbD [Chitinophagaceae bacterium]HPH30617.1 general stress protein CsbD [Chitinophagaceae bacterium]HPN59852.1 general stress protein CsbD [Chitinophagaceae bacterium]